MRYLLIILILLFCYICRAEEYKMAALGDSIVAGVFASSGGVKGLGSSDGFFKRLLLGFVEKENYNFATGGSVASHCEKLKLDFPHEWTCHNFAVSGATTEEIMLEQVPKANELDADYVVWEGGFNDICSDVQPTPVMFYNMASQIAYELRREGRAVVVVGIPDITSLYELRNKRNFLFMKATTVWNITENCNSVTKGKKLDVIKDMIKQYNDVLRDIAKSYGYYFTEKTANMRFTSSYISRIDMFHPSAKGQQLLSDYTYPFKEAK